MSVIEHPSHYQHPSGIECKQIAYRLPGVLCNLWRYTWRWEGKNGLEDLRKAREVLNDLDPSIAHLVSLTPPTDPVREHVEVFVSWMYWDESQRRSPLMALAFMTENMLAGLATWVGKRENYLRELDRKIAELEGES